MMNSKLKKCGQQPPDSLSVTISAAMIRARHPNGYKRILNEWFGLRDGQTWWFGCNNKPKYADHIEWVYIVIGGKYRYRCKLAGIENGGTMKFDNQSELVTSNYWFLLFDFEELPAHMRIRQPGFRGFRYCSP